MTRNTQTPAQVAAQVAVEAVINAPSGFDKETAQAVLSNGVTHLVPELYIAMLRNVIRDMS